MDSMKRNLSLLSFDTSTKLLEKKKKQQPPPPKAFFSFLLSSSLSFQNSSIPPVKMVPCLLFKPLPPFFKLKQPTFSSNHSSTPSFLFSFFLFCFNENLPAFSCPRASPFHVVFGGFLSLNLKVSSCGCWQVNEARNGAVVVRLEMQAAHRDKLASVGQKLLCLLQVVAVLAR